MEEDRGPLANVPNTAVQLQRDPVCGMNVDPTNAKFTHEHGGKNYYFCCGHCVEKFKSAPQTYVDKTTLSGMVTLGEFGSKSSVPGPLTRDPVCDVNVNPAAAKFVTEWERKKYYFCSRS